MTTNSISDDNAPRGASVAIVGGGVTGLSAAWWLARAGIDVLVLEKGIVGWEASGRNGGGATHYYSPLFREEQRLWPQMDALLGYPTEFRPFRVAIGLNQRQLDRYLRMKEMCEPQGFRASLLDPQQVRELVPFVGEDIAGGVFFHFGGQANPQRTVQAYAWAVEDLGGRVLQHAAVTGFTVASGRVAEIHTTRGRFGCERVVLAAGPQTAHLLARLGVYLPLACARTEMLVTAPLPLIEVGGADGNGLYGRQTLRGNLAYGGGPHEWIELAEGATPARPTTPLMRNIARRLVELFPKIAHVRLLRSWAGVVENTPDGRPVIDRLSDPENVVVVTMSSVGFGLSPASGEAIAEIVRFGKCSFADLSSMRLDRFANHPRDWRQARGWLPPETASG